MPAIAALEPVVSRRNVVRVAFLARPGIFKVGVAGLPAPPCGVALAGAMRRDELFADLRHECDLGLGRLRVRLEEVQCELRCQFSV